MKTRIISGLVIFPVLLITIYLGGTVLSTALLILSLIGLHEFYKAINGKHLAINYFSYAFTIIYYALINMRNEMLFIIMFIIFTLVLFCYLVFMYPKINIMTVSTTILGVMYIPVLFSCMYYVRELENGIIYVWPIIICAFATDTFAYFFGVFFGKHKLIPGLSPNKTIEGSLGGIFSCVLISAIYGYLVRDYVDSFAIFIIIGFFGSIFAQFGDLTASSVKRFTGVKDFGKLIPGHGGILDRFDSILFTSPIVYIAVYLLLL